MSYCNICNNRLKITTKVTPPNCLDSSTCWDGKPSSSGALHVWCINQLLFSLSEKLSSLFKTEWSTQFYPRVSHRQFQIHCVELRRRAMLLSADRKKLVCVVRWVKCDARTMHTYLGFSIRATGNDKMERQFWSSRPSNYKPLSKTGWKDMWTPTWPLHQPWRQQTETIKLSHLGLKSRNHKWYVIYACVAFP